MVDQALIEQVKALPESERLELIDALWATLEGDAGAITDAERARAAESYRHYESHPERAATLDEALRAFDERRGAAWASESS